MQTAKERGLTPGEIARQLDVPTYRVQYVINSRRIQPVFWAGNVRIFSKADADRVGKIVRELDARRDGRDDE